MMLQQGKACPGQEKKKEMILLKYTELKEVLKKYPHCFRPLKEQQREFDRMVALSERKPIVFAAKEMK